MNQSYFLSSIPINDLKALIGEVIEEKLHQSKLNQGIPEPCSEFGTRKEVCNRLKISLATLYSYTKNGTLTGYRIGGRILYKWIDIEEAVKQIQTIKYRRSNP